MAARAAPRNITFRLLAVATGVYAIAGLRDGREKILGGHTGSRKA